MIEQKLEKTLMDAIADKLASANITGYQIVGVWQPAADGLKAMEDVKDFIITTKAQPRSYETPTIPDAQIEIGVSLLMRSDVDYDGHNYLHVTSIISDVFQSWQNDFSAGENQFTLDGEFTYTGFQLGGGDCGVDVEKCVWSYTQTMTVYGIIL